MAGIKITDLPADNKITSTDAFLKVKDGSTFKISGQTFIQQLSGITSANSLGSGSNIYNSKVGSVLNFNTITANNGITCSLNSNTLTLSVSSLGITSAMLANKTVQGSKIADLTIQNLNLANGSVTPIKQSGTLYNVANKTNIQTIGTYSSSVISGLSATVTPPSTNSAVLLTGFLSVGGIYSTITLRRTVNGVTTNLLVGDARGNRTRATMGAGRFYGDAGVTTNPISYIDTPNTISPVMYTIVVGSTWGYRTNINTSYDDNNGAYETASISQLAAIVLP